MIRVIFIFLLLNDKIGNQHKLFIVENHDGGDFMISIENLRFVMDETSAPYEQNENPFSQTDADAKFEKMIINKYHLVTEEMEIAN